MVALQRGAGRGADGRALRRVPAMVRTPGHPASRRAGRRRARTMTGLRPVYKRVTLVPHDRQTTRWNPARLRERPVAGCRFGTDRARQPLRRDRRACLRRRSRRDPVAVDRTRPGRPAWRIGLQALRQGCRRGLQALLLEGNRFLDWRRPGDGWPRAHRRWRDCRGDERRVGDDAGTGGRRQVPAT